MRWWLKVCGANQIFRVWFQDVLMDSLLFGPRPTQISRVRFQDVFEDPLLFGALGYPDLPNYVQRCVDG